jgi:hypothetical protein
MWARYLEIVLGAWLIASPWIFGHATGLWLHYNDVISGSAVVFLAAASFTRRGRWAHLLTGAVAVWLGASAYFGFDRPGPPAAQNEITLALLLLTMFAVPNESSDPPVPWRGQTTS